jgi:xanthine dehydrogenase FAD-binding subunit
LYFGMQNAKIKGERFGGRFCYSQNRRRVNLTNARRKVPPEKGSTDPMPIWTHYHTPSSLNEALRALAEAPGSVRLIAGGTDLLLDLQQGRHPHVDTLVDVNNIIEMKRFEIRDQHLYIGAAVPLKKIAQSSLVLEHAQALTEASGLVGGPQVRNTATLGGNVAHALPAADGTISLMALDAVAEVASEAGLRTMPLVELFKGPGQSTLDPRCEILSGFFIPLRKPGQASSFSRVMRPQGVALPILNMSCWIHRDGEKIVDIRLSAGPSGPTPRRMLAVEDVMRGETYSANLLQHALAALLNSVRFRTSPQRATAEYRQHLSGVLLEEVVEKAWGRAELIQVADDNGR